MKVRRKEVLDCFYLTKDNIDEFVKWCWEYIRICDSSGNDYEYNIVKNDKHYFCIDWETCKVRRYFNYNFYYVIDFINREYEVKPYTKKELEEEFEVIE